MATKTCPQCTKSFGPKEAHCKSPTCPWCRTCVAPMADKLPGKGKPPPNTAHPG